jgi:hypothetical protein
MKHALAIIAACSVLCAQNNIPNEDAGTILRRTALGLDDPAPQDKAVDKFNVPKGYERAAELKRLLHSGKLSVADIHRMSEEGKINASELLYIHADGTPSPQPQKKPTATEKPADTKPKIPPINIRDELIELVHSLKIEAARKVADPINTGTEGMRAQLSEKYDADLKARAEAQRLLLQALVELAKEAEKPWPGSKRVFHSSAPEDRW